MVEIRILVELAEGVYVVTAFDEYGPVASAASKDRDIAIRVAKKRTREKLGDCNFTQEKFQDGD